MTVRTRSESGMRKARMVLRIVSRRGGVSTSASESTNACLDGKKKVTVDELTPYGYKRLKRLYNSNLIPPYARPFAKYSLPYPRPASFVTIEAPENTYAELSYENLTKTRDSYYFYGDIFPLQLGSIINEFISRALVSGKQSLTDFVHLNALSDVQSAQVDVGTTLGELLETVQFLANPLNKLVKQTAKFGLLNGTFRHLLSRSGKVHTIYRPSSFAPKNLARFAREATKLVDGKRVVDEASNFWLGYRFGVKPLLADIKNYADLFENGLDREVGPVLHGRGKYEIPNTTSDTVSSVNGGTLAYSYRKRLTSQRTYRTCVYYLQKKHDCLTDLQTLGLHPTNLPGVLWELVPLSFVIDRFVGIGAWLNAQRPKPGVEMLGTTHSIKDVESLTVIPLTLSRASSADTSRYPTEFKKSVRFEPFTYNRVAYQRTIGVTLPVFPAINPRLLDLSQWTDHLTLLWQRMPRWRK